MNPFVLGIIVGVILTLFCIFCIDAWDRNNRLSDSEIEAWEDWCEEWERRKSGYQPKTEPKNAEPPERIRRARIWSREVPAPKFDPPPPPPKQPEAHLTVKLKREHRNS